MVSDGVDGVVVEAAAVTPGRSYPPSYPVSPTTLGDADRCIVCGRRANPSYWVGDRQEIGGGVIIERVGGRGPLCAEHAI